ncbi:MAG TPA: hypothetical protein VK623_05470 [Flavobacterium sp.]|nr:hypothetical protein [Flavobacterium sp.]
MRLSILCLFVCCLACKNNEESPEKEKIAPANEMAFDKTKWGTKNGAEYVYRDKMLKDLIGNKLKGLRKEGAIGLLGQPDRIDNAYLFYKIAQERIGFFPLHTKTLVIKLSNDSIVEKVMIHE